MTLLAKKITGMFQPKTKLPGQMTKGSGYHYGCTLLLRLCLGYGAWQLWVTSMTSSMLGSKTNHKHTLSMHNLFSFLVSFVVLVASPVMNSPTRKKCTTSFLATGATLNSSTHTSCLSTFLATTRMLQLHLILPLQDMAILCIGFIFNRFQALWNVFGNRTHRESRRSTVKTFHSFLFCSKISLHGVLSSILVWCSPFTSSLAGNQLNFNAAMVWLEYSFWKVSTTSNTMVLRENKMKMESMSLLLECTHGILNLVLFNGDSKDIQIIMLKVIGHTKSSEDWMMHHLFHLVMFTQ